MTSKRKSRLAKPGKAHPDLGKIVHVAWLDACSPSRKWGPRSGVANYGPLLCESVGWLERADKDVIVLAADQSTEGDDIGGMSAIPRNCVKSIRRLK